MALLGSGFKRFAVVVAAGLAVSMPLEPVHAQSFGSGLGEGIGQGLGRALGDCIFGQNCARGNPRPSQPQGQVVRRAPQPWSAERVQRANVQKALNEFGYPVGKADGIYGGNTSRGMTQYQSAMGFPPTGSLNPWEEQALLNAHNSYTTGSHNANFPGLFQREGLPGLLRAHADPNYYPQNYGTQQPIMTNTQPNQPVPNQPVLPRTGVNPQPPIAGGGLAPLAPIEPIGQVSASMQDHCDIVKLATQSNGGQVTSDAMIDPDQALDEQFCDARTYLMGRVQNVLGTARATEDQLVNSCSQIANAMKPVTGGLGTKGPDAVSAEASGISGSLGLTNPNAAAEYGEVCIGLGYRTNDSDMALAGAVVLAGAGRTTFGEMVGHHVRNGFGTSSNSAAASDWYNVGLAALEGNQPPAVLPSQTIQRSAIIRAAVDAINNPVLVGQQPQQQLLAPLNLGNN